MKLYRIIYICLCIPFLAKGQNQSSKFKHLTLKNGLSQTSISCILKDSRGFMWFGTEDGLNKYDGSNFTIYRHVQGDKQSLSSSYINAIVEQDDGFLWIGTKNGLNYFNPDTEKFTHYMRDADNAQSLGHNQINTLQKSNEGFLLIGTSDGLNIFDPNKGFSKYTPKNKEAPHNVVAMAQDQEGYLWVLSSEKLEKIKLENSSFSEVSFLKPLKNSVKYTMLLDSLNLWIGSSKGLIKLNLQTQKSTTLKFNSENVSTDNRNKVHSIVNRQEGKLWIGTLGGGLIDFDKKTGNFQIIRHDPYDRFSLNSSSIISIFQDERDILWLGTFGGGINKYDPGQFKFKHYKHHPGNNNSLSENTVRSILMDKDRELWVGTHNGLNRMDREYGEIEVYRYNQKNPVSISSNVVRALAEDSRGKVWIGTWDNGLNSFDKKTGKFKRYISLPGRKDSIGQVRALETDNKGNIWIGSHGLWKFNTITNQYKKYFFDKNNNKSLNTRIVNSLYFDKNGLLWIGTQNGLNSLDTISNSIKTYFHNPKDTLSISHKNITSIVEGKKNTLWIGTYGGGLNKLNISKGTFQHYNTNNGLLNDVIYGVLVDNDGFIWFTSNAGLARLDPFMNEFEYFGVSHGIQSEEFNAGAYFKSIDDELFFGGINGFNSFYPKAINTKKETSKIVFTDFQLLDDKNTPAVEVLDKHISRAEHIELNYNQNTFSVKFAELNYAENIDNNYEYQLKGFKKNWSNLGKIRLITLGNLKPGKYTLNVRVRNDLTKQTSIKINISKPIWQSNWAFAVYLLLFFAITAFVYRNIKRTRYIRKQFELKIQNWENDTTITSQLHNHNDTGNILPIKEVEITSRKQKFLERVTEIVEDHIEDSSFDVKRFADEMFMSRSQLHRKLKTVTGYSTTEFIRLIRLKRAAQLLSGNTGTVSEIAYKVGFENIGYFSKCFRETFGTSPSQYKS